MNALNLLRSDHNEIEKLFDRINEANSFEEKCDLFEILRDELLTHCWIEETVFYPTFAATPGFETILQESMLEHQEIKEFLDEIGSLNHETELDNLLDDLEESIEQHVDEEEMELFPKAEEIMTDNELEQLGDRLISAKQASLKAA